MRTATIMIRTISLVCPHCHAIVTGEGGEQRLRDDEARDRWEELSRHAWDCPQCKKPFALPANPFATGVAI